MTTRIKDMPVYAQRTEQLPAPIYNLWRRAHMEFTSPLRLKLEDLKQLALILEDDCWVLVDQRNNDMPVLAWVEFQNVGRTAIHEPVDCTLNLYHHMAGALRPRVLAAMEKALHLLLHDPQAPDTP